MTMYLENFGLDYFKENEEALMGLIAEAAENGNPIVGYYGLPYLNRHYGDAQFILRTGPREDGDGMEIKGVDSHAAGYAVWEGRLSTVNLNKDDEDPLSRRMMVSRPDGKGMAVVNIVNADVLPSFLEGDEIRMQVIAFPDHIEYYADDEEYEEM